MKNDKTPLLMEVVYQNPRKETKKFVKAKPTRVKRKKHTESRTMVAGAKVFG